MPYGLNMNDWPGTRYFWDPNGGDDTADGLTIATAHLTFASVYGLLTSGQGDHVVWVDPDATVQDDYTTAITLSKDCTALFGPGPAMAKISTTAASPAVSITGADCLLRGFTVETTSSGTHGVYVDTGGEVDVVDCYCTDTASVNGFTAVVADVRFIRCRAFSAANSGFSIQQSDNHIIECIADNNGAHGVSTNANGDRCLILNSRFQNNGQDGANLAANSDDILLRGCIFIGNGSYGIDIGSNNTTIVDSCSFANNTDGPINAGGLNLVQTGGIRTDMGRTMQ